MKKNVISIDSKSLVITTVLQIRFFVLIFFIYLPLHNFAQISKGVFFIGGSLGSSTQTKSGNKTIIQGNNQSTSAPIDGTNSFIEFKVGSGFFVGEKVAIGLNIGVSSDKQKEKVLPPHSSIQTYEVENETNIFFANPFLRYYIMIEDNFGITINFDARYQRGRRNQKNYNNMPYNNTNYFGISAGFTPGFVFFPTSRFGLEANMGFIGYNYLKEKTEFPSPGNPLIGYNLKTVEEVTTTGAGFNVDTFRPLFNLGCFIYLGGN